MLTEFITLIAIVVLLYVASEYTTCKKSGMRAMAPIPYDWDRKSPIVTTNNVNVSALFEQVSGGFIFPAV